MRHENSTFEQSTVVLDENDYVGCTFKSCTFVYKGGTPGSMQRCTISTDSQFHFHGSAGVTLAYLGKMYQDPAFRPILEKLFDVIRSGQSLDSYTN